MPLGAGLCGFALFVSGVLFGRSEAVRDLHEANRVIPACATTAGNPTLQEDEIRFDFVGGVGATIRCVQP